MNRRRISHNFLYNLAGLVLPLGLVAVSVPLFARYAGLDRLGFLTLAFAVLGYLGLLDLGLSRVFARRVAIAAAHRSLDREVALMRSAERWLLAGSSLLAVLLALAAPTRWLAGAHASSPLVAEVRWAWVVLVASLPALVLSNFWRGGIEGLEAFARSNLLRIGIGAATYAVPLLLLAWTPHLAALVGGIAAVRWISYALYRAACLRMMPAPQDRPAAGMGLLRTAFFEGGWMTLSNVIGPVMVVFDRFALTSLVSLAVLSTYSIPQELVLRALLLPAALSVTIFPRLAALSIGDGQSQAVAALADRALRTVLALMLPACLIGELAARPILALWVNPDFAAAATVSLLILMVGAIGNTIAQVPFGLLQAAGASRATAMAHLIELPLYGATVWIAIRIGGIEGAAIAWSGRMVLDAAAMLWLAAARWPALLTRRGAYAMLVSLVLTVAMAGALLARPGLAVGMVLAAASVAIALTFLRRGELRGYLPERWKSCPSRPA